MDTLTVLTWRVPAATASILEAATLPEKDADETLRALRDATNAPELVYLPTCQRVLIALHEAAPDANERIVAAYAAHGRTVPPPEVLVGYAGFRHLCEVAASLDSLVLGEPQVMGQVRAAAQRCDEAGISGPALRHVFALVSRTAKAVRNGTDLFRGKVSLVPLTVDLVADALSGKTAPRVAVLGTGQIGEKMVELFKRFPGVDVHVVSRSLERAHEVASAHDATGHPLARFLEAPPERLDVIALAMRTEAPILAAKTLEAMAHAHPLVVLDLAIPRNAEAPASPVEGLTVIDIDDLTQRSEATKARRQDEYVAARAVLDKELGRVRAEYAERKLTHELSALTSRFAAVSAERRKLAASLGIDLDDPAAAKWFDQTIRALLHEATASVKRSGASERAERAHE